MVAGCGMNFIKYTLFVINFLFFALGIVAVALGIYALVDKNDMAALTKIDSNGKLEEFNGVGLLQSGAIVLIVGGACLIILGFLGCCGAVKEVRCLLATFAAIVIVIVIIELAAVIIAGVFKNRIEDKLKDGIKNGIKNNYDGNLTSSNAFSRAFDFAQVYFECCGVDNVTNDFFDSPWYKNNNMKTPQTCCKLKNKDAFFDDNKIELEDTSCPNEPLTSKKPNTQKPCYSALEDWIREKAAIIIGIAVAIIVVEILAIIFACCLYRAIEQ